MSRIDIALKTAEHQQAREMTSKFNARMSVLLRELGQIDTLRRAVLTKVAEEQYEAAIEILKTHVETKTDYPQLIIRTERHVSHAVDLINAVKAKRSFPGMHMLPMSKQQDLFERAIEHFDELKHILQSIERVEREVKLDDIRSTVWVIKAVVYCITAMMILGILMEVSGGVLPSAYNLVDRLFGDLTNQIFDKLGF